VRNHRACEVSPDAKTEEFTFASRLFAKTVEFRVPQDFHGYIFLVADRSNEKGPVLSAGGTVSIDPHGVGLIHSGGPLNAYGNKLVAVYPDGQKKDVFPLASQSGGTELDVQMLTIGRNNSLDLNNPREQLKAALAAGSQPDASANPHKAVR
jgi:hypothetical protein